jgi:hypothetical protein
VFIPRYPLKIDFSLADTTFPVMAVKLTAMAMPKKWLQRVGKRGADSSKCRADCTGQLTHGRGSAKGDDSNNQSVFNQVLAFIAAHHSLNFHVQLEKHGIHLSGLLCVLLGICFFTVLQSHASCEVVKAHFCQSEL